MLEVIEGKPPLPRWFPPYEHGLFATDPQLGWEATPRSGPRAVARTRRSSTTSRPCPTCRTSSPGGPTGSARWAPPSRPARSSPPSSATSSRPTSARSSSGTSLRAVIDAVGSGVAPGPHGQGRVLRRRQPGRDRRRPRRAASATRASSAIGSGMGAAGFIVYDDTTCMVDVAYRLSRFLSIESCGQCPPCKIGSGEITEHLERLETGGGSDDDLGAIRHWLERVTDGNRCYLAVEEQAHGQQHPARLPRGVRRAHRARPLPPPPASSRSPSWSTSPTDRRPTTRPSGASDPTGPLRARPDRRPRSDDGPE